MKKLPEAWHHLRMTNSALHVLVLVDTAMQHNLGRELAERPNGEVAILEDESEKARAMGLWLMEANHAEARGIDGSARGVNWLLSRYPLKQTASLLRSWAIGPFPDGTERGYIRLGDSRTLRSLVEVWSQEQRMRFFSPFKAWCYGDRDGTAALMQLPEPETSSTDTSGLGNTLDSTQYEELLKRSIPDQLLHELKGYVRPHETLALREERHRLARSAVAYASSIGYTESEDHMTLIAWALRVGVDDCRLLSEQPAIRMRVTGGALWEQLMAAEPGQEKPE